MLLQQKIFAVVTSFMLFSLIIYLVKKEKLKEEFSWIWFMIGVILLVLTLWYDLLLLLTALIGAITPTTTLFIFGIISLLCLSLHFAIKVSKLTNQVKNLAQKVSLLEVQITGSNKKGFTFIEVLIATMIMMLLLGAIISYHSSSAGPNNQKYYLKAVQTAKAELEKLKALYELDPSAAEFADNGAPPNKIFLFKFDSNGSRIELPNSTSLFHVHYTDHGYSAEFLMSIGNNKTADNYHAYYETAYNSFSDADNQDRKTFTYFTDDGNSDTDSNVNQKEVDASIVVIDDMGSAVDPGDDLIGNIGWWIEDVSGGKCKKLTFVLQFWYPGQQRTIDPEVIVLKTTLMAGS